jgi:hypothetical protein
MNKSFLTVLNLVAVWALITSGYGASEPAKGDMAKGTLEKPQILEIQPRGVQIGTTNRLKLIGTNLLGVTELVLQDSRLKGELLTHPEPTTNAAWIELVVPPDLNRGAYEISVKNTNSESGKIKLYVDDLPQVFKAVSEDGAMATPLLKMPVSFWGVIERPGDADEITFQASKGDSIVFDLAARSIGSKANMLLTLMDERGSVLAANNGFDGDDPLMQFRMPAKAKYRLRIGDRTDAGSKDHFYRLSIGAFPVVVGYFPLGIPANQEADVQLIGFNLPPEGSVHVKAGAAGELEVPIDSKYRTRRLSKLVVVDGAESVEREPNDRVTNATPLVVGTAIDGRVDSKPGQDQDVDIYEFEAHHDQTLAIETDASRRGSPIDTKIEVLYPDGKPVERLLLHAVRDSQVTFRSIDSNTDDLRVENWQEMELNQLMYLQGEVCKIFRMPQGPDSGFQFYSAGGKRRNYFDTSPVAHALEEPAYIVEPHAPGSAIVPNGLPVFTVYYANDDDADRSIGSDSRLLFTPPRDGKYLVRVTDTRGLGGERFAYRLLVRQAKPDFKVTITGVDPSVNAGAGKDFTAVATRIDGFDGDIRVEITGLPPGFSALTPLVIQAGHLQAKGTINASIDASAPAEAEAKATKVTATALINGQPVIKEVNNLGKITLASKPKLLVAIEPYDEKVTNFVERSTSDKPLEITIASGQSIPAWLKIKRNGHEELVTFTVESLPHGVIVDNIGLNGVLIPKGQDARRIFLTAAKWVPEVDRLCFAKAAQAEAPTSLPVLLHVRKATPNLSRTQ